MENESPRFKQDLAVRIDELKTADSLDESSHAQFSELCEEAVKYAEIHNNADSWHLAAWAWYEHPATSTRRSNMVRFCEAQALEIDPTHQLARQYLVYQQFDEGEYEDALKSLELLAPDYFENLNQHWRVLKNRELALAAQVHLGRNPPLEAFKCLLEDCVSAAEAGDESVPLELANALVASVEAGGNVDRRVLELFRVTVHRLKFEDALREQLDRLDRAAI